MLNVIEESINLEDNLVTLQSGLFGNQADGSVIIKVRDMTLLCNVVSDKSDSDIVDFFPLTVNYVEKSYANGQIPGGYFKRESRQSEHEILLSRLIDRSIRPIFQDGYFRNTQVTCFLLSYDKSVPIEPYAIMGCCAAIAVAKLPTKSIVSAVKIGYIDNKFVLNPSKEQMINSALDLSIAGTKNSILMVESEAKELTEDKMIDAIKFAQEYINKSSDFIAKFKEKVNKNISYNFVPKNDQLLYLKIESLIKNDLIQAFSILNKIERNNAVNKCFAKIKESLSVDNFTDKLIKMDNQLYFHTDPDLKIAFDKLQERIVRDKIIKEKIRIDGRKLDEIREIDIKLDVLPKVHGSAVFTRGETQVLAITTLGNLTTDKQQYDSMISDDCGTFMLHYNFYGFSAGDPSPMKAPGRREIGHGRLAFRALNPLMPNIDSFPYTTRVVAEVTSSDGSTSMATVCSSSLSLMSTGVPMKSPVAGIAMGLIKEKDEFAVLTDIMADEDHLGDMDFKVTGTKDGITALQMDIKIDGIDVEIVKVALNDAKKARNFILDKMIAALPKSREKLNDTAPKILTLNTPLDKIPEIIGKSGSNIKMLCEKYDSKIDISQDGVIKIFGNDAKNLELLKEHIISIIEPIKYGQIFDCKVKSLMSFGAIVEIDFNRTGLVHISEISDDRVENIESVLKEGDLIKVKFIGVDNNRRNKFSIKALNSINNEEDNQEFKDKRQSYNKENKKYQNYKKNDKQKDNTFKKRSFLSIFKKKEDYKHKKKKRFIFF